MVPSCPYLKPAMASSWGLCLGSRQAGLIFGGLVLPWAGLMISSLLKKVFPATKVRVGCLFWKLTPLSAHCKKNAQTKIRAAGSNIWNSILKIPLSCETVVAAEHSYTCWICWDGGIVCLAFGPTKYQSIMPVLLSSGYSCKMHPVPYSLKKKKILLFPSSLSYNLFNYIVFSSLDSYLQLYLPKAAIV